MRGKEEGKIAINNWWIQSCNENKLQPESWKKKFCVFFSFLRMVFLLYNIADDYLIHVITKYWRSVQKYMRWDSINMNSNTSNIFFQLYMIHQTENWPLRIFPLFTHIFIDTLPLSRSSIFFILKKHRRDVPSSINKMSNITFIDAQNDTVTSISWFWPPLWKRKVENIFSSLQNCSIYWNGLLNHILKREEKDAWALARALAARCSKCMMHRLHYI